MCLPGNIGPRLKISDGCSASLDLITAFAAEGGERVVTAGTCAEYSWEGDGICREDMTPLEPASLYGASKDALRRMQESLARQLKSKRGLGTNLLPVRSRRAFGAPGTIRHSQHHCRTARSCSHGRQVRDFMYVDDVA